MIRPLLEARAEIQKIFSLVFWFKFQFHVRGRSKTLTRDVGDPNVLNFLTIVGRLMVNKYQNLVKIVFE